MQTMNAHFALRRGMRLFAGMLVGRKDSPMSQEQEAVTVRSDLFSWCSEARTRRGDEMARRQFLESPADG
jgi:hypothetical protein